MEMIEAVAYGNEPAVLEDASGRRARWMRRAGRAVFVLFLACSWRSCSAGSA